MIAELNGDFLQWLRGFYYVAKTGSVRKAAELMRRNPSTISYQLHSLEEELGTVLFDRHKKVLHITPEGETILKWAVSTFETLQNLLSSVGAANGDLQGGVRVAMTLPVATMAVKVISDFTRAHPKVDLCVERFLSSEVRRSVAESTVDFGILPVISRPETDNLMVVAKSRPLLVLHKDNPWNVPRIPAVEDLERLPYVAFSDRDCQDDLGNYIMVSGMGDFIQKNAVIRCNNYHLIMRFVWQRLGVAIMDEMCFQATFFGADWHNLEKISLDHIFPNRLYGILTRRHKHLSPQASALMNVLKDYFLPLSVKEADAAWRSARQCEAGKNENRAVNGRRPGSRAGTRKSMEKTE